MLDMKSSINNRLFFILLLVSGMAYCDNSETLIDTSTPFRCTSGHLIDISWVCDTHQDCHDKSDESFCSNCSLHFQDDGIHYFQNKLCIQSEMFCKCHDSCWFEEDGEKQYEAVSENTARTMSKNGECPKDVKNKPNKELLTNGEKMIDSSTSFRCNNGNLIDISWLCDTNNDCQDNSDESFCSDCSSHFQDDGIHYFQNKLCIQTETFCKCHDSCWFEEDGEKQYKSVSENTTRTMSQNGECPKDVKNKPYKELLTNGDYNQSSGLHMATTKPFSSQQKTENQFPDILNTLFPLKMYLEPPAA